MTIKSIMLSIIIALFSISCTHTEQCPISDSSQAQKEYIQWYTYSRKRLEIAKLQKRPVLVFITNNECEACNIFFGAVLSKQKVIKKLNDSFVNVSIDNLRPTMEDDLDDFSKYHGEKVDTIPSLFLIEPVSGMSVDISAVITASFLVKSGNADMFLEMLDLAVKKIIGVMQTTKGQ